jgi:hypothetical protein
MQLTSTRVIKAQQVANFAIIASWVGFALLIASSWYGTYIQLAGGWSQYDGFLASLTAINGQAAMFALVYQLVVSGLQWGFLALYNMTRNPWFIVAYVVALGASVVPSYLTYNSWVGDDLTAALGGNIWAGLILGIAVVAADVMPERGLVGR